MRALKLSILMSWIALVSGCVTAITGAVPNIAKFAQCKANAGSRDSIVGGQPVSFGDPDQKLVIMLTIRHDTHESVCTGALIGDRAVITAAHCLVDADVKDVTVIAVTSDGCVPGEHREARLEVIKITTHAHFDGTPQSLADLALVYLSETAPAEQLRLPLLKVGDTPTSDSLLLLGFGITDEKKKDSQILRRIRKSLKSDVTRRERAFYINQRGGSGGFCRGDSGAPVIVEMWGEPRIMGINSANIGITPDSECQTMSLAMDAVYFTDWITRQKEKLESSTKLTRYFSRDVNTAD